MGRHYYGDIEGKMFFAVQPSFDASFFGGEELEPQTIEYYFGGEHLEYAEEKMREWLEENSVFDLEEKGWSLSETEMIIDCEPIIERIDE